MTAPVPLTFAPEAEADLGAVPGTLVVFVAGSDWSDAARAVDAVSGGALARAVADPEWKNKAGATVTLNYPAGLAATRVVLATLGEDPDPAAARKTGAAVAKALGKGAATLCTAGLGDADLAAELVYALVLRLYDFTVYKSTDPDQAETRRAVRVLSDAPEDLAARSARFAALAEGVFFTRDLVSEPANILTTDEFAARLAAMQELGLEIEILGEPALRDLGARSLLAVGQGSPSESKIVVMKWLHGPADQAPLALVGKGVVFDTGGISIKPAQGMEEMTMDMGGAAVVAGVMRTLALRGAKCNVVGLVGLVENMPDGLAQRPGDIIRSMKGDTIEVINTDAEGRLVLADVLWHAQTAFQPQAVIDLATLTGAVIVALGHAHAGYYATCDTLAAELETACKRTGDTAWRLPLGKPYAEMIKSRLADIKNSAGRNAGSITAAEFLHRFVKDGTPWVHLDIAGVTLSSTGTELAPKGATGWGVAALDALIRARLER